MNVRLEVRDHVAWLTLDGPANRNALDETSAAALVEACETVDADPAVGAAVVTGAGGAFCSGADRSVLRGLSQCAADRIYDRLDALYRAFQRFGELKVPTVAAVEGAAVGAGLNLALAADVVVAADDALLVPGFAENGIHPGGGHLHLLAHKGSRQIASALGIFGERTTGARAAQLGLVWQAVPAAELAGTAHELARRVAADAPLARALKNSLRLTTSDQADWRAAIEVERARQMWSVARRNGKGPQ
ncbi:enoyl-CoA hydratase-related protein [Streptomyces malaysiensis]|uniref:enoyl-CoA hydratase-related protein n=1 Tax=Streptomyces malaysiensis TaxID=92644 RepID=UPI002B30B4BE|nr:enoyl-CoA hydratase-related protein [Streptomyces malaysiensis]